MSWSTGWSGSSPSRRHARPARRRRSCGRTSVGRCVTRQRRRAIAWTACARRSQARRQGARRRRRRGRTGRSRLRCHRGLVGSADLRPIPAGLTARLSNGRHRPSFSAVRGPRARVSTVLGHAGCRQWPQRRELRGRPVSFSALGGPRSVGSANLAVTWPGSGRRGSYGSAPSCEGRRGPDHPPLASSSAKRAMIASRRGPSRSG